MRRADPSTSDVTQTVTEAQAAADRRVDPNGLRVSQMCGVRPSQTGTDRHTVPGKAPAGGRHLPQFGEKHREKQLFILFISPPLSFKRPLFYFPLSFFHQPLSLSDDGEKKRRKNKRDRNAASALLPK